MTHLKHAVHRKKVRHFRFAHTMAQILQISLSIMQACATITRTSWTWSWSSLDSPTILLLQNIPLSAAGTKKARCTPQAWVCEIIFCMKLEPVWILLQGLPLSPLMFEKIKWLKKITNDFDFLLNIRACPPIYVGIEILKLDLNFKTERRKLLKEGTGRICQ